MKTQTLLRLSRIVLLAVAVSAGILALLYAIQSHDLGFGLATVSWNG